ncbi:MAG: LTA synthase family protein [Lentimicrobiaceae bacterium]|nr:LTA synthase family protein [Lentimicrobiaceae bacterium]
MIPHFYKRLSECIKIYLLLLSVFLLFRLLFLCTYGNLTEIFQNFKVDFLKTFWVGFRCDTVVLCFALTPPLLLNIFSLLCALCVNPLQLNRAVSFKIQAKINRFLHFFDKFYYIILFVILFLINVVDHFYYRNFQARFDSRVFGIVEDGTKEVMASVWADYPVVILTLVFVLTLLVWIKLVNKLQSKEKTWFCFHRLSAHIIVVVLSIALWFLGARSSFSTFPFQKNDLVFSVNLHLNDAAANGVFKLKEAISERLNDSFRLSAKSLFSAHGFASLEDAKRDWDSSIVTDSSTIFERTTTSQNPFLENNPPHIVLILMEGWSSDFFQYHSSSFNLLGSLKEELPYLIFYPFCFPVNYGTISAMETFFTNNVGPPLSMSKYAHLPLKNSTALALKEKGYETSYYTAGYTGWRNVGNYCRTQGFDHVCDAAYIKTLFSKTEEADWGVFDQYMYDAIFQKLQDKKNQPQFLICMTITNHSPHKIPKNYTSYPLHFPETLHSRITKDLQQTLSTMQTFQYANDCLGKFLNALRHSNIGENTIVVITGDHAMTGGFSYKDTALLYCWAVPLAFYVPESYAQQLCIDTSRLVSHKDILPTIYHLAFSNYSYRATGDNIFDTATAKNAFVMTQSAWVMGKAGVIHLHSNQSYNWHNGGFYLQPVERTPELEFLRKKANAWYFGMKWQVYTDIREHTKELK